MLELGVMFAIVGTIIGAFGIIYEMKHPSKSK